MLCIRYPVAVAVLLYSSLLIAAPGDLDPNWGGAGKVTTAFDTIADVASASVQQKDGKIVAVGHSNDPIYGYSRIAILRYNQDGSLDSTFSGDGKIIARVGDYSDYGKAVIQQANGKLVVAGSSENPSGEGRNIVLLRYNSNGLLDASFGGDGIVTTLIGAATYDTANALIQQPDGKLVVAGVSGGCDVDGCKDFALVRYNADGSLDTTFSDDGKLTTSFPHGSYDPIDIATALVLQPDGKLVVAGYTNTSLTGTNTDVALVRYNPDGSLDATFDGDGIVTTAFGAGYDFGYSLLLQADNKLVVAGMRNESAHPVFALARYNSNGSLDTSFDGDGILATSIGGLRDYGRSIIQQSDGKLVVGGFSDSGSNNFDFALVRYNLDGSLDSSFGASGIVMAAVGATKDDQAFSLLQQSDGRLMLAGASRDISGNDYDFALMRFESGQIDGDGDGFIDALDIFSADPSEYADTDGDGIGNNADTDDDSDGVLDSSDTFPLDASESVDTDGDGTGNNADLDDDNDGVLDYIDANPLNATIATEKTLLLNGNYRGSSIRESVLVQ